MIRQNSHTWCAMLLALAWSSRATPRLIAQCRDGVSALPIKLTVTSSKAINDPDPGLAGAPEMYLKIIFKLEDGTEIGSCTEPSSTPGDGRNLPTNLTCEVSIEPPYDPILVEMQMWDWDGGLGGDDDHLDIDQNNGKNLNFIYDPLCDKIASPDDEPSEITLCADPASAGPDCRGSKGFRVRGDGDAEDGEVKFTIGPTDGLSAVNNDLNITSMEIIQVAPHLYADAIIEGKPTMVRVKVGSTYPDIVDGGPVDPLVTITATDELGVSFPYSVIVDPPLASCESRTLYLYPPGWDGVALTWGFSPNAAPGVELPIGDIEVSVAVDPAGEFDTIDSSCTAQNNSMGTHYEVPIKPRNYLDVLFQPLSDGWPGCDFSGNEEDDGDASAVAGPAAPYMLDIFPVTFVANTPTSEVLDFPVIPIVILVDGIPIVVRIPQVSLAAMDLLGVLADPFDRLYGVVKEGYFDCHYSSPWSERIGASAGESAPHVVMGEKQAGVSSSELVAHELGHSWGLSVADCPLGGILSFIECFEEYNWCDDDGDGPGGPCGDAPDVDGVISYGFRAYSTDPDPATADKDGSACVMGNSHNDPPTHWIDPADYNQLIRKLKTEPDPEVLWLRLHLESGLAGTFYKDDPSRMDGIPEYVAASAGGPALFSQTTSLVFKDDAGGVLDSVNFSPESVDTNGDGFLELFTYPESTAPQNWLDMALLVALPAGTDSVDLVRVKCFAGDEEGCTAIDTLVTDTLEVPAEEVDIEIAFPVSSVLVRPGDLIPIGWRDTPGVRSAGSGIGPRLSYILISPDNGASWIPIAGRASGNEYTWQVRGYGRYLVRVFTTNGFNTDDARGESDLDGDGCADSHDPSPSSPNPDSDGDGVADVCDNCPMKPNAVQQDADQNGVGDACDYAVLWHSLDCGGTTSTLGGIYALGGTIGQHDVGTMSGGIYVLKAGFWHGGLTPPPQEPGDCDADGDVDLNDYTTFESCLTGPGAPVSFGCECADLDQNGEVDLLDFAEFQTAFTG